jgi:transcriptional regulator with XRE-family HTH domain
MAIPRQRLKARRERQGLTQEQLAQEVGVATSTYAEWEQGSSTPRPGYRPRLAVQLDLTLAELAHLIDDEIELNGHEVPGWLGHLASLEQAAARICAFETVGVHGLLQIRDYATAVERAEQAAEDAGGASASAACDSPGADDAIARRVETRMARQGVLERRPDPLRLDIILDESVLYRMAGDRSVMADQLDHLVAAAARPNVDLRVLTFGSGMFAFGSFTLLSSPGASAPYMAITEDRGGPHYMDRPTELDAHTALYIRLSEVALDPAESIDHITAAAKEHYR